jgi:hypothetical protein
MEIELEEIKKDLEHENQIDEEQINKQIKQTIMTKYVLVKETTINGAVSYSIEKDGKYVSRSVTHSLEEAERYLHIVTTTGTLDTIKEKIKTIEVNENELKTN